MSDCAHLYNSGNFHCTLQWNKKSGKSSQVVLSDNSSNGTWVNNVYVTRGQTAILRGGAAISLGGPPDAPNDWRKSPSSSVSPQWASEPYSRSFAAFDASSSPRRVILVANTLFSFRLHLSRRGGPIDAPYEPDLGQIRCRARVRPHLLSFSRLCSDMHAGWAPALSRACTSALSVQREMSTP